MTAVTSLGRRVFGLLLAACGLLITDPAHAYRTAAALPEIADDAVVRWAERGPMLQLFDEGAPGLSLPDVQATLSRAAATWHAPDCSAAPIGYIPITSNRAAPGDGRNTIEWLTTRWAEHGFDPSAAGMTDVVYQSAADGSFEIVEADIYLNGENNDWTLEAKLDGNYRDVLSVATHEIGHALGLRHPCEFGVPGEPDCASDPAFADTTMYPFYVGPEQVTLADDDIDGICFLYSRPAEQRCAVAGCDAGYECTELGCVWTVVPVEPPPDAGEPLCPGSDCDAGVPSICNGDDCDGAAPGDPCSDDKPCLNGVCMDAKDDSYCAQLCETEDDCPPDSRCDVLLVDEDAGPQKAPGPSLFPGEPEPQPARICVGPRAIGTDCEDAKECLGGECISGLSSHAFCTRRCGSAYPVCPENWDCESVDDIDVCVFNASNDSGCGVAYARGGRWGAWMVLLVAFAAFLRRRAGVMPR